MASFKNVNTDYTLTCDDGNGVFTINAQTVFNGNVTYTVPAVTIAPFLTVAANNTGAIQDGGLLMQTGPTGFAGFRFDTVANVWQVSSSVYANGAPIAAYANLAGTPGGANTQIQFNSEGSFGGDANLAFNSATNQLTLNGTITLGNINVLPPNVPNAVVLFSSNVGAGGTGVYATSDNSGGADELVANYKAIVYGIIF
jgi:hypothetical protein